MKLSNVFFTLFYGAAFVLVVYLIYSLFTRSAPNTTTVIYEQPAVEYPVTNVVYPSVDIDYPWYGGYNYYPYWWPSGGYWSGSGWGYRTRPGRWGGHRGGVRDGIRGGGRIGGGGGRIGGGGGRIGGGGGRVGGGGARGGAGGGRGGGGGGRR